MSADVIAVFIEHFSDKATEASIDAVAKTHENVIVGSIMEHIEADGIHSSGFACYLPTNSKPYNAMMTMRSWTISLAKRLGVIGLMDVQWATKSEYVYI